MPTMARNNASNRVFHEFLFAHLDSGNDQFDDDIPEFTFFMDGNTLAKERFEREHPNEVFPIIQQTFVVPEANTVSFASDCLDLMKKRRVIPTEIDILFVRSDDCLMSATYKKSGFALTLAFENYNTRCPPAKLEALLHELSALCRDIKGRLHLVKNLRADKCVVRKMFHGSIEKFEEIKCRLDPKGILRNAFFDRVFKFDPS